MSIIIPHPSAIVAVKTHHLHDVDNDTKCRLHSGTAAMASVTGEPMSRVRDAVRLNRHGAGWVDRRRAPAITKMHDDEIESTLRLLGYAGERHDVKGRPTLAAYLKARTGIQQGHPCIVFLNNHRVAISGGLFCDVTNGGLMVDIDRAPWRRKQVHGVFVLTHRIPTTPIPPKTLQRVQSANLTVEQKRRIKELDRLFREAVKAETGATRIKVTATEVFIIRPVDTGWTWCGARDGVVDSLLKLQQHGWIGGNTDAAAAYRATMGY
ncbi:hypothetical protein [Agrobacterium deltaense]|uniref:hypothetical protein n=1 Tax=Agrobacterium deltaense TaxID=1183412 RepID=UPI0009BAF30C|nr:hypothetical protein [Agrobacterium deltaense]CUX35932.1 conserved hypothetical protein [Agrobacterium deltaense RV3]